MARKLYQHTAATTPATHLTSRFLRGWALFEKRQENVPEARALFRHALQRMARDTKAWTSWAAMERARGNLTEALRLLREARPLVTACNRRYLEASVCCVPRDCRHLFSSRCALGSDNY